MTLLLNYHITMRIRAMLLLLSLLLFAPNVQGFLQDTICNVFPNFPIVCQNQNDKSSSAIYCNANPTNATKSQYDIQFAFRNVPLSSDQTLFTKAEKRWQQVLKGDVPDVILDVPIRTSCGDSPLTIDDIFICAHYDDIDGPEGILGSAGVIASRSTTDGPFPAIGEMRFDSDDVGFLGFANVIVHEIGHILGIGSTWDKTNPALSKNISNPPCPYKTNSKASVEWRCLTGCTNAVPTEQNNQGINCINWDEDCLQQELMTGQTTGGGDDNQDGQGGDEILSQITTASLQDIGYLVNYEGAEQFTSANVLASCRCNNRRLGSNDGPGFLQKQKQQQQQQRQRSEASLQAKEKAINFGKQQLTEKALLASRHLSSENATVSNETTVQFVQDQWISVFYMDPDTQHVAYVMVQKEDL